MDVAVDKIHDLVLSIGALLPLYQKLTLLQFPHSSIFSLGANAINGATAVYAANVGKPRLYWLNSLVLVVIGSFGGGTLAPLLIGRPSMIVWNDQIIVLCMLAWYATHYLGCQKFLTWLPVKMIWTLFLGLFRTHSVINVLTASLSVLGPTPYYPIPIIGPIVVGTALGCLGMFLPFDKGLAPIKNGTPWNLQGALITATFYHLMVNDNVGFLGHSLRAAVGTYDAPTTKMILATMHIVSLELQVLFNADANIFTPIHKLLYLLFQVQGPLVAMPAAGDKRGDSPTAGWDMASRSRLAKLLDIARVLTVAGTIVAFVYIKVPPHSLYAVPESRMVRGALPSNLDTTTTATTTTLQLLRTGGWRGEVDDSKTQLRLGDAIGSCQLLQSVRACTPYLMRLEVAANSDSNTCTAAVGDSGSGGYCQLSYQLAVYQGTATSSNRTAVWSLPMPAAAVDGTAAGEVSLHLSSAGELLLLSKMAPSSTAATTGTVSEDTLTVLWSSRDKKCLTPSNSSNSGSSSNINQKASGAARLMVDGATGHGAVVCADGTLESL